MTVDPDGQESTHEDPHTANFRVASTTNSKNLAGAITQRLKTGKKVILCYIGPGAGNQALKAAIIARQYVAGNGGQELLLRPSFEDVQLEEGMRTGIRLEIILR